MKTEIEDLDRFCDMFQATLDSITENRQQNTETEGTGETKRSMAGLNSKTANKSLLQQALRMEEEGEGKETIRMETGWIKGADKYWRYEIDDSKMEIDDDVLRNDLFSSTGETTLGELLKHDELFKAYPQLKNMPVFAMGDNGRTLGTYSPSTKTMSINKILIKHIEEYGQLRKIYASHEYKDYRKALADLDAWENEEIENIQDQIDDLNNTEAGAWYLDFETYTDRDLYDEERTELSEMEGGEKLLELLDRLDKVYDESSKRHREIVDNFAKSEIGRRLKEYNENVALEELAKQGMDKLKNTLIHEIQHAIQDIEGFAMGASEKYWENAINNGYDNSTNSQKERQKELAEEYQRYLDEDEAFVWDMHDLLDMKPDMPRGKIDFDTLEQIEEDPPEWKAFDRMRDELAEKYGSEKVADFIFLYDEMMNPRGSKRSAWDLYYNTAGEIEARDTESRRTLNAEERKNTRPDMYRTDVVFAEDGENTHYSMAGIGSRTADKSLLRQAKKMERNGDESEKIRKETGWFKGYDGKWRYEIDDSTATLKENPAFEVHETDEGEIYRTAYLKDILENAEILSAYPSLGDYLIIIQDTLPGVMGETFHRYKHIVLNQTLFERYTKEYNDYLNGGRKQEIARIEQTPEYREYSKYFDDEYTDKLDPETWLREEKAAQDKFFSSELGKRYYQLQWGKVDMRKYEPGWSREAKRVLFHELQHAIQRIEGFASGATTRNPNYERVAGEVEARDTAARAELTAEQRKETRPDIDRTDVVFADIKYSRVLEPEAVNYDNLIKKPDMRITTVSGSIIHDRKTIVKEAEKNILSVGKESKIGIGAVYVDDIERNVIVSRNSISHGLDRRTEEMSKIMPKIGEILQNAIQINELYPKLNTASGSYVLVGVAKESTGDLHIVRFIVNEFSNHVEDVDILYAINTKKEPAALLPRSEEKSSPPTGSTISISNLLESVKDHFPDVLSMDVLNHFGIKVRPSGELGQNAKWSRLLNNSALDYADRLRQTSRQYWEMLDILEDMAGGSQYHNPLDDLLDESNLPEAERQRLSDQTLQRIARKYIYQKLGKKTGKATPEQVRELAEKLKKADAVLAGAKENIDVVVYGLYKIFKKDMQDAGHYEETELWVREFRNEFRDEDGKKVKVYIPANVRTDVTEDYGGPNGFRKAMFGMMDITYDDHAGGIDLKEFYSNLRGDTEDSPGANVYDLPDTDNPSDMINNIVRWYNTDPYSYTPETDGSKIFGMTLEEAATRKAIEAAMDMIYFCEFKEFKKSA